MNHKEFFEKVARMRDLQKQYFRTRDKVVLSQSIQAEKEIERVKEVLKK
jgi:hypothetical protein